MKISIIIPALNEEDYLPKLLESIKKQTMKDYEVIIADAGSKDRTVSIAKKHGAKVVRGGMPAKGRNNGAKAANGDFLFFFDADVILPKGFLGNAYDEMQGRFLDLATCEFRPISNLTIDKVLHGFANMLVKLGQFAEDSRAPGFCILVTRRLFDRVGGFDESLKMAEDRDFVSRASKFRPLRVLESASLKLSVRRLDKEGRLNLLAKYLYLAFHQRFRGKVKDDIFEYEFGNFGNGSDVDGRSAMRSVRKKRGGGSKRKKAGKE
ncbi:MAG: glycosyltransferase [Candidatus Woesearchaeota archaeon]